MTVREAPTHQRTFDSAVQKAKVPPHSLDAERSLLGSILLDNKSYDDVVNMVISDDFYLPANRLIFQSITTLIAKNSPCDILTVSEHLNTLKQLQEVGGESYIFEIANATPSAANVKAYAQIVKDRSILRKILSASTDIAALAYNPDGKDSRDL